MLQDPLENPEALPGEPCTKLPGGSLAPRENSCIAVYSVLWCGISPTTARRFGGLSFNACGENFVYPRFLSAPEVKVCGGDREGRSSEFWVGEKSGSKVPCF